MSRKQGLTVHWVFLLNKYSVTMIFDLLQVTNVPIYEGERSDELWQSASRYLAFSMPNYH
jgi:hypothetical protein